jgi:hypothetical protein
MMKRASYVICFFMSTSLFGQAITRQIHPNDTDPQISTFNIDSHYVYLNQGVPQKNILVVHLPGSFGEPKRATLFGRHAADLGFHSIGLMYPNIPTIGSICSNSTQINCFEEVRREIIEGVDYSTEISIEGPESILSRTKKILIYLEANYPNENWGQFLDTNENIAYNKVIFSGHSQGGGHAALLAKYYPLKRAVCFSAPKDWRNTIDSPPIWLSTGTWQTSSATIYGFNHENDEHLQQLVIWQNLGLNNWGNPMNIDITATPYNHTRQLTTTYNVPLSDAHACTIQDNKTPKVSNIPVFLPVWTYMLTHDLEAASTDEQYDFSVQPFPNPTNDFFQLNLPNEYHMLRLFDQYGKCVLTQSFLTGDIEVNLVGYYPGMYFIEVVGSERIYTGKIWRK